MGTCWLEAPRATTWLTTFDRCPAERSNSLREFLQKLSRKGFAFQRKRRTARICLPRLCQHARRWELRHARAAAVSVPYGGALSRAHRARAAPQHCDDSGAPRAAARQSSGQIGRRDSPDRRPCRASRDARTLDDDGGEYPRRAELPGATVVQGRGRRGSRRDAGPARERCACKSQRSRRRSCRFFLHSAVRRSART
jgi:hypothetical protein